MKSFFIFIVGIITGAALLIVTVMVIGGSTSPAESVISSAPPVESVDSGIVMFDEASDCVSSNKFKVIQVLNSGDALAIEQENPYSDIYISGDLVVLFLSNGEKHYYDDQMIDIQKGKCAKHIGTYKYSPRGRSEKTVPIVEILPK